MHDRLGIMPHVVETVLGHVGHQGGTAGRYNRALYRDEKAAALRLWAELVSDIVQTEGIASFCCVPEGLRS